MFNYFRYHVYLYMITKIIKHFVLGFGTVLIVLWCSKLSQPYPAKHLECILSLFILNLVQIRCKLAEKQIFPGWVVGGGWLAGWVWVARFIYCSFFPNYLVRLLNDHFPLLSDHIIFKWFLICSLNKFPSSKRTLIWQKCQKKLLTFFKSNLALFICNI